MDGLGGGRGSSLGGVAQMPVPLDRFMRSPDVGGRYAALVPEPARLVLEISGF